MTTSLLLLSGGQDSTTSLFWAKKEFDKVEALTFDYNQRHWRELISAKKIAELADIKHKIVKFDILSALTNSAMTSESEIKIDQTTGLPTTFVAGRNLLFVTLAAGYAYAKGIRDIVIGVSQVDYSGYPDCREETIKSLEKTISLGMATEFRIHTPLIYKSKKETVLLAQELGCLETLKFSHTCYEGKNPPCGQCPACILRAKGFEDAGCNDPLLD